ncbi:MAG: cell division ATP-binding protein FtsE [Dethiobacteria bacterium]|jgi:cell division transport system ATP-binding protein|nr:cell division ATP-binding protein FtsE [Bacillota bacterium]
MIEFYHVHKEYPGGVKALNDVNLTIDRGEFVFIIGPSGAGKSTIMKLLIREIVATKGKTKVFGQDLMRMKRSQVPYLRRNIGIVFQDFRLLEERTVFENVAFAMRVVGTPVKEIKRRVPKALELVGLKNKEHLRPSQLSGGERQRVGMARAIVNEPVLLLADEPTGNLDPETASGIMNLFKQFHLRGTTVVVATHAQDLVNKLQKRVICLEGGRIIADERKGAYVSVR